jgi:TetR/AcrR family transcriptional repressor of nem operon
MGKPTSSLTTAISIRIPNDLLDAVANHASAQGLINESGRLDKRGQPNLSAAVSNLLKQALDQSESTASPDPSKLSDSVSSLQGQPLEISLQEFEHRLTDRLRDAVAQQLNQFLSHYNAVSPGIENDDIKASKFNSEAEASCESNPTVDPQEIKEDTRERILHAASRGFRSHGYNGIGVNTLAKDAGVTSGAFYGYFRSKEDAFLATVVDGLEEYRAGIKAFQAHHGTDWSVALADYYVGRKHRQDLACGCALPTLSPEVIRSDRRVRSAYQTELIKLNDAVAAGLLTGTATEKRDTAWVILSVLAGGVTLARAVWDEALAEQIATAVHHATVAVAAGNMGT